MDMQSYNDKTELTNNLVKKISPITEVSRAVRVANFAHELREKSFAERYELLYYLATGIGFLSQLLSMWASYLSVHSLVSLKAGAELGIVIALILLLAIEAIKYALVNISFSQVFSLRPVYPYPILFLMLVWSAFSMYLCVSGSSEIAKDKTTANRLTTEQAGKERELKQAINEIQQGDSYKDVVWSGGGKSSKVLSKVGKDLIQKRESELDSLRKTYQVKTNTFNSEQAEAQKRFNYFFAVFEVLFLFCTMGAFYYKRTSAIENLINAHQANTPEPIAEVVRTISEPVRTEPVPILDSANLSANLPEPVRSEPVQPETVHVPSETNHVPSEPVDEIETEYANLLQNCNTDCGYLEKYKDVVKSVLAGERQGAKPMQIKQYCLEHHSVGSTTYHNVLRMIKEIRQNNVI